MSDVKNISMFDAGKQLFSLAFPMLVSQFINMASGFLCMTMLPLHYGAIGFVIGGMFGMAVGATIMLFRWQKLLAIEQPFIKNYTAAM